jgi:hypothetical protein
LVGKYEVIRSRHLTRGSCGWFPGWWIWLGWLPLRKYPRATISGVECRGPFCTRSLFRWSGLRSGKRRPGYGCTLRSYFERTSSVSVYYKTSPPPTIRRLETEYRNLGANFPRGRFWLNTCTGFPGYKCSILIMRPTITPASLPRYLHAVVSSCVFVVTVKCEIWLILAKASPLNP